MHIFDVCISFCCQAKRKRQRRARAGVNRALELANYSDNDSEHDPESGDEEHERDDNGHIDDNIIDGDNENNIDSDNNMDHDENVIDNLVDEINVDNPNNMEHEINADNEIDNNNNTDIDRESFDDNNENEGSDDERNNLIDNEGRRDDSGDESDQDDRFLFEEIIAEANVELNNGNHEDYLLRVLKEWARRGVSFKKIDSLLKLLHPLHPYLPLTHNTLLGTPHHDGNLPPLGNGKFWYKGILKNLEQRLTPEYLLEHNEIVLDINIDGLSPFKSTRDEIWPILGKLKDTKEPFIIAAYFGKGKPNSLEEFLHEYVEEAQDLTANGIQIFGNHYNVVIRNYILDAPARAFVKCIASHNSMFSCEKCETQSVYVNHTQTYPDLNAQLRTDNSFQNRRNALHHEGDSPLERIPTGMISSFRLDSLHLVHAGVMKRWLMFTIGRQRRRGILNDVQVTHIEDVINNISAHVPRDFNRRPRLFQLLAKFHATEFRRILLYDGLVLFKDINAELWKSFKLLHASMYILSSPSLCRREELLNVAHLLTRRFVQHSIVHLGRHFPSYNVHALPHLIDECRQNGPLDDFSAYPYENYLGVIKSLLRSKYKPLEQLVNRDTERKGYLMEPQPDIQAGNVTLMHPQTVDPDEEVRGRQYTKIVLGSTFLEISEGDNCFKCKNGHILLLKNIIYTTRREIKFVGQRFHELADYYEFPLHSSNLGVFKVSHIGNEKIYIDIGDFLEKCVLLPCGLEEYVAVPLLHSQNQI